MAFDVVDGMTAVAAGRRDAQGVDVAGWRRQRGADDGDGVVARQMLLSDVRRAWLRGGVPSHPVRSRCTG
jgi:hypothetical protein